jgi:alpha-tubulin suppressor-like RCC1 family protein
LLETAKVMCWGANLNGQLGDGTVTARAMPAEVAGLEGVEQLSVGANLACARTVRGDVQCWGSGFVGGQGLASSKDNHVPTRVRSLSYSVASLDGGAYGFCAATRSSPAPGGTPGTSRCWGLFSDHEVNDVPVASDPVVRSVQSGFSFACHLLADGRVSCVGNNTHGELGNGGKAASAYGVYTFVLDPSGTHPELFKQVSSHGNGSTTCAIKTDGFVSCWGRGNRGQLGNASFFDKGSPQPVTFVDASNGAVLPTPTIAHVSTSIDFACAIADDGRVFCWGDNTYGKLGTGKPSPVQPTAMQVPL